MGEPEREIIPVAHRGPDASGTEVLEACGQRVTLAHWRLSILDPQAGSNQPLRRRPGGPVVVFNGEIYNYIELRRRIGGEFRTAGDTEVLLAAYEKWGTDCLRHLRGMFAFVIADPARRRVLVARDRFGIKPLYWRKTADGWEFASEIKQLLGATPRLHPARVRDFLVFGAQDHTADTLFDGIGQLRGGEMLEIDLGHPARAEPQTWYRLPSPGKPMGDFEDATRAYREKMFEVVSLHLRSDVPLGFCLSGGMDSSALIGVAGARLRGSGRQPAGIHCHFSDARLDESRYARDAAALAGARLIEVTPPASDLVQWLERVTFFQDEPLANASILSQYAVFQMAREQGLKVMVDGQGGDELLASYPQFFGPHLLGMLRRLKIWTVFNEARHFREDHDWRWADTLRSMALWFTPRAVFRIAKRLVVNPLENNPWATKGFLLGEGIPMPPWQRPERAETRATTRSMSLLMIQRLTLPMLLHWEDRNSMAHGVESRVPFLDHELVEMTLALPDEFKIRNGVTKRILKSALRDIVPPSVVARRDKLGFATPEERWLRQSSDAACALTLEAAANHPEILNEAGLRRMWQDFSAGGVHCPTLWRVTAFAAWTRVFGVG